MTTMHGSAVRAAILAASAATVALLGSLAGGCAAKQMGERPVSRRPSTAVVPQQLGRLTAVQGGQALVTYSYDALGRPTQVEHRNALGGRYTTRTEHGYPVPTSGPGTVVVARVAANGERVAYGYDRGGQRVTMTAGGQPIVTRETHDAAGRAVERQLGDGSTTRYAYEPASRRLERIDTRVRGELVQSFAYAYDEVGNVTRLVDGVDASRTADYRYDSRGQLVEARVGGEVLLYAHDGLGNLTMIDGVEQGYEARQPHAVSRSGGARFAYDGNGNRERAEEGGAITTIAWTADNRVASVTRDGRTITSKRYLGDELWSKIDDDGATRTVTEYLPGALVENGRFRAQYDGLAERTPDGSLRFFHRDQLENTRVVTDGAGAVVSRHAYRPFGQPIDVPDADARRRLFGGRELDLSGYYEFGARNYDPRTGRWLSPDTEVRDGFNRFTYVMNNPVSFTDPTGHAAADAVKKFTVGVVEGVVSSADAFGLFALTVFFCVPLGECGPLVETAKNIPGGIIDGIRHTASDLFSGDASRSGNALGSLAFDVLLAEVGGGGARAARGGALSAEARTVSAGIRASDPLRTTFNRSAIVGEVASAAEVQFFESGLGNGVGVMVHSDGAVFRTAGGAVIPTARVAEAARAATRSAGAAPDSSIFLMSCHSACSGAAANLSAELPGRTVFAPRYAVGFLEKDGVLSIGVAERGVPRVAQPADFVSFRNGRPVP